MKPTLSAYQQNQNLSHRLIESVILYLRDINDESLPNSQHDSCRDAVFTLLDSAIVCMNDELSKEATEILMKMFSKVIHDVAKNDSVNISKDILALSDILSLV